MPLVQILPPYNQGGGRFFLAKGINIQIQNLDAVLRKFKITELKTVGLLRDELNAFGLDVERDAKTLAPTDEGNLKNSISYNIAGLDLEITVSANYAAYVEFGTRRYAAEYVSKLPADWQSFAKQYQGKTGGSLDEMLLRIMEWVKRKGLAGTYSVKTGRRTGAQSARPIQDAEVAYPIALAILRNGIRAQPFLYPAYEKNRKQFIDNLKRILNK